MTKLQEFKELQQAVATFATLHKDAILAECLASAFKVNSDIKAILIKGYTPGFNDGEPCTHTQYTVIDGTDIVESVSENDELSAFILGYDSYEEMEDDLEEKGLDRDEALANLELPGFGYQISREVDSGMESMNDVLEEVMGTNWCILAVLNDDGEVKTVVDEYYDCGY